MGQYKTALAISTRPPHLIHALPLLAQEPSTSTKHTIVIRTFFTMRCPFTCGSTVPVGGPFPLFRRLIPFALIGMPVLGRTPVGRFLVIRGHHARTVARHAPQGLRLRRRRRRRRDRRRQPVLRPPTGAMAVPRIVLQQGRQ